MRSLARASAVLALVSALVLPQEAVSGTWRIGRAQSDCPQGCHFYDAHPSVEFNGGAIAAAMVSPSVISGDTIRVWPGEYSQRFTMKSSVVLISQEGPDVTVLTGAAQDPLCLMVGTSPSTTIQGFTITWDGQNTGTGGGIGAYAAAGNIRNNIFRGCQAALGAGVYLQFCTLTLENNLFLDNACSFGGGVIAVTGGAPTIRNNTIVDSEAPLGFQGAALYASGTGMVFENNVITGSTGGTAVYCTGSLTGSFGCNVIWDNPGGAFGGSCADSVGASGNQSVDPLFCNPGTDSYNMCADSPALTGPCGAIGYQPAGGPCPTCFPTPVAVQMEYVDWGRLKSRYR